MSLWDPGRLHHWISVLEKVNFPKGSGLGLCDTPEAISLLAIIPVALSSHGGRVRGHWGQQESPFFSNKQQII